MNLTPIFHEYLRHAALPVLELKWSPGGNVHYRWQADESTFAMPVLVGTPEHWQKIKPTNRWQTMQTPLSKDQFQVATDLFYVKVVWMP
jgi:hypothetical protein